MKFYQFFLISICNYIILLCSTSKAQSTTSAVVYNGEAVVNESDEFTLTCFVSHFPILKWTRNGVNVEKDGSESEIRVNATSRSSTLTIKSANANEDGGNYKCTSESDDYGHNVTVTSASIPKLKIAIAEGGKACSDIIATKQENCVLGTLFSKLRLNCVYDGTLNSSMTLDWYRSTDGDTKYVPVKEMNDRRVSVSGGQIEFSLLSASELGLYQCRVTSKNAPNSQDLAPVALGVVDVGAFPMATPIVKDMTVVEGSTINITCAVTGKASHVLWKFGDKEITNGSENRVIMKEFRGISDATLLIQNANSTTDRGHYQCTATGIYGNSSNSGISHVRIKSKYAALAPFLGICAEVIILCTIILIYEKKRDKTELEESDTDQGPETKSSPDHGQDSVRYRK